MAPVEPRENLSSQPQLHGRTLAWEGLAKPRVELSLAPAQEALMLLEEHS
jgi:hypothetical protein